MKSITLHNLDDRLNSLIRKRAKKQGASLNKTIKMLLEEALGIKPRQPGDHREEFMDMFGIWSKKEAKAFSEAISDVEKIDAGDWK